MGEGGLTALALSAFLAKFARRARSRWWFGDRPDVRDGQLVAAILRHIHLPEPGQAPFSLRSLVSLTRAEAAHVLAVAASTSLAYGTTSPRASLVNEASDALVGLGEDATFFGNDKWDVIPCRSWQPLTAATFECGVVGFNAEIAFAFWVEDED